MENRPRSAETALGWVIPLTLLPPATVLFTSNYTSAVLTIGSCAVVLCIVELAERETDGRQFVNCNQIKPTALQRQSGLC